MRSIKLHLILIMLFLFILALPNSVSAFPKYRVAILPIIKVEDSKNIELSSLIQYKIHRKLRFPFYQFISDSEVNSATKTLSNQNGYMIPNQINLSVVSQTLSADIVLVAEIVRARADLKDSSFFWNDDNETIEDIDVLLKLYVYSGKDNKYYVMKAAKSTSIPLSVNSGLIPATDAVIDDLLKQLPFQTIPTPLQ